MRISGCTCVPDFAMWMMSAGVTGAEGRQAESEEPEREMRVNMDIFSESSLYTPLFVDPRKSNTRGSVQGGSQI